MSNKQRPEPVVLDPEHLLVHSSFHTIQGEGPFAGCPAIFIRLGGCNIQCPGCDTEYTQGTVWGHIDEVMARIHHLIEVYGAPHVLVITGGEPLRQAAGVVTLINCYAASIGLPVQIETNGSLPFDTKALTKTARKLLTLVVSPKGNLAMDFQQWWNLPVQVHFKYVVKAGQIDPDGLPTRVLERKIKPGRPYKLASARIWLQPMDEQDAERNTENAKAAASSCLEHGYRLTMQLHKLVELP